MKWQTTSPTLFPAGTILRLSILSNIIFVLLFFVTLLRSNSSKSHSSSLPFAFLPSEYLRASSSSSSSSILSSSSHIIINTSYPLRVCTDEEIEYQGGHKGAAKVRGCPPSDDVWMRFVHIIMPQAKIFIDIGSNKGYTAARWFSMWSPEVGLTNKKLHEALIAHSSNQQAIECGACGDCKDNVSAFTDIGDRICGAQARVTTKPTEVKDLLKAVDELCKKRAESFEPIKVFSFDGNTQLIDATTAARNSFKNSLILDSWRIELAAFSDVYIPGKSIDFVLDGELGHIVGDRKNENHMPTKSVPLLTVDQFMFRENLRHIDFLKIDTEGHDLTVIQGAMKALSSNVVTVLLFEYNKFWPTYFMGSDDPLGTIVYMLQGMNYICYLEGKNLLLRLTFCWSDELKERQWSNVWCLNAKEPEGLALISVFDSYSLAFN